MVPSLASFAVPTVAGCPLAVVGGAGAAVAPLPPPPQPTVASALRATAAPPARKVIGLLLAMVAPFRCLEVRIGRWPFRSGGAGPDRPACCEYGGQGGETGGSARTARDPS